MKLMWLLRVAVVVITAQLVSCRKHANTVSISDPIISTSHILIADTNTINRAIGGYYIALPHDYDSSKRKFPLLIFLHGLGQRGNGKDQLSYLLFDGIGKAIKDNRIPPTFTVSGENFSFIIASPQYDNPADADDIMGFTDSIIKRYRVRTNRVYLSGLSLGARIVTLTAGRYPEMFAAILPIAGVATNDSMSMRCEQIAHANLPVWALHNADDPMSDVNDSKLFIQYINEYHPGIPPRLTIFDQYGHDAWTKALDTAYRENGRNIYEWMLQYYR